ncbi:WD repeat-containing protein [Echinococcus granulosus]|uniref:Cilia- and flagella-associated protein 52 n=1 Tax=Echinococcus granulosus TaxID=6210 RepID=W6ULD6_ECHGR|nr:WD repeat-containing protein [Echinococcus granulosus]EUB62330.1 WD repeat-containing protein [Echinococcus granulosus]
MSAEHLGYEQINLRGVIGFNGSVEDCLHVHPDRQNFVYALGCAVVIEDLNSRKQNLLQGHTSNVVCLAVSRDGCYVASGQITHMGYKADIILWDYAEKRERARFVLHNVKVQALAFSPNSKYLASIGGQDDGSPAQLMNAGITRALAYANLSDDMFFTGGDSILRIWRADVPNRKIRPTDCNFRQYKRTITKVVPNNQDEMLFCATTSGDILAVRISSALVQLVFPERDKFSLGITSLCFVDDTSLIIGTGEGIVQMLSVGHRINRMNCEMTLQKTQLKRSVMGTVTAITLRGEGHQFFVGTDKSHIYRFDGSTFEHELINSCHYSPINDIKFPENCSDLFVTSSFEDIRVFHTPSQQELLRINIPNLVCFSIDIVKDGTAVISGELKGVTAIAATANGGRLISGGGEGQVRVWQVREILNKASRKDRLYGHRCRGDRAEGEAGAKQSMFVTTLLATLKEHANTVSCIKITKDDNACASSSADGTCIVWSLVEFTRMQIIFANTLFRVVCFHTSEVQLLTAGTDRKIGYWEMYDGSQIRELEASRSGSINGMDIAKDGAIFVTGGDDKIVKVWRYNEGDVTHVGLGHSSPITRLMISPDQRLIVTVSEDGGIFLWDLPPH